MDGETEYASCAITANFSSNFCTSCHLLLTIHFSLLTSHASGLHAVLLLIRPFKLDRVTKHLLKAPRANVTDFSIGIVIPTQPRDRIGDCFTQLMRTGCG